MDRSMVICGEWDTRKRAEAYRQVLGSERVSTVAEPCKISDMHALIDIRGDMEDKRRIPTWQERGAFIIADDPPAATLEESQAIMACGGILLARPSYYDHRYELLRQQISDDQIEKLVAVRMIRLWPEDSWLSDGVTLDYGFDAFDALCSLLGGVKRIMAREQRLKRDKPDTLLAIVAGENDAIGYLELCTCHPQGYQSERIEVIGHKGILEYNSDVNRTLRVNTGQRVCMRDAFREPPLSRMVREYLNLVDDDRAVRAHAAATRRSLHLVYRALKSSRQNRPA